MIRELAALALMCAGAAGAETLTNADVVALRAAGLSDEVILAKIRASATNFDTSTAQLIALKGRGVSAAVITAMIGAPASTGVANMIPANVPPPKIADAADSPDPRAPHAAGVYLLNDWQGPARMIRIDATGANQAKSGGVLGYALTGGLASMSVKAVIPGGTARTHAHVTQPVFYFYVAQTGSNIFTGPMGTNVTPNEFSLVRLTAKAGRREARVGSMNIGGMKAGVMDKDRIAFAYDEVAQGVYRVQPAAPLAPGEYGFLYQPAAAVGFGGGASGAAGARVFDFSVGTK